MQLAAERADIPIRLDAALVLALFHLELTEEIPRGYYEAVAALLRERDSQGERAAR